MGKKKIRRNDRVEGEDAITRAADVEATVREGGVIPGHISRGLEVLIKKAAVDPAFKIILFEKRAEAAKAIGLKLTAAEEAMLAAVPLPHLEGIVAHTRISPKLRPAFLGYAAGAMLAAIGTTIVVCSADRNEPTKTEKTPGIGNLKAGRFKTAYPGAKNITPGKGYGMEGLGTLGMRPSGPKKTTGRTRRRDVRPSVSAGARAYEIDRPPRAIDAVVQKHIFGIENAYNSVLKENP
ncbi:MAG: hypothetical protein V3W11_07735, partial [bacterium]